MFIESGNVSTEEAASGNCGGTVMAAEATPFATARVVTDPADCYFYHSMDIPGYGEVDGEWDLRPNVDAYLGGVDLRGKRVLEVGTANGFLCMHMERQGADVIACDLSEQHSWDVVPFAHDAFGQTNHYTRDLIRRLNNAFWLAHRARASRAHVVYTPACAIPEAIGPVDVATYCSILLHLRDPFAALASGLRLTRETVVVTDMINNPPFLPVALPPSPGEPLRPPDIERSLWRRIVNRIRRMLVWPLGVNAGTFGFELEQIDLLIQHALANRAAMIFLPDHRCGLPCDTWWSLSPEIVCRFLGILGFEETTVTYHTQFFVPENCWKPMFTVVGRRTAGQMLGVAA
jgi:hypothetical protein